MRLTHHLPCNDDLRSFIGGCGNFCMHTHFIHQQKKKKLEHFIVIQFLIIELYRGGFLKPLTIFFGLNVRTNRKYYRK